MPKQMGFLINLKRCISCHSCEFACSNEHNLNESGNRKLVKISNPIIFAYLSLACNHCENPECIRVCPQKCYSKRRDGIVVNNPLNCNACKSCINACPYNAPKYNPYTNKVNKCNFCLDRLLKGKDPICVSSCSQQALKIIDLSNISSKDYQRPHHVIPSVRLTNPSVRFILPDKPRCSWRKRGTKNV